ncbi:hypothetical protein GCM10022409_15130 [Hymenobacter glaciei]|uniref:Uncharacterized protein n=1 Tax=Hymenobacter glaciei TaxID=877209 RepID=A0ABP7TW07_9BACT
MNQPTASGRSAAQQPGPRTPTASENEAPLTGFADASNTVFQAVDKNRVSSGILEEYGLQFIDHTPFTGTNGFTTAGPSLCLTSFPFRS